MYNLRAHICPFLLIMLSVCTQRAGSSPNTFLGLPRGADACLGDIKAAQYPLPTWCGAAERHGDRIFIAYWERQVVVVIHHAPRFSPRATTISDISCEPF